MCLFSFVYSCWLTCVARCPPRNVPVCLGMLVFSLRAVTSAQLALSVGCRICRGAFLPLNIVFHHPQPVVAELASCEAREIAPCTAGIASEYDAISSFTSSQITQRVLLAIFRSQRVILSAPSVLTVSLTVAFPKFRYYILVVGTRRSLTATALLRDLRRVPVLRDAILERSEPDDVVRIGGSLLSHCCRSCFLWRNSRVGTRGSFAELELRCIAQIDVAAHVRLPSARQEMAVVLETPRHDTACRACDKQLPLTPPPCHLPAAFLTVLVRQQRRLRRLRRRRLRHGLRR